MIKNKIIIIGGDNYNTCGMVRTLGEANYDFTAIIIGKMGEVSFTPKSKYFKTRKCLCVDSFEEALKALLKLATKNKEKSFLLVEGDHLTSFLDEHYDELESSYIWNNAGEAGRLAHYMGKYEQEIVAKQSGIKTIDSIVVKNGDVEIGIEYPVITKAVSSTISNWKGETFICNNQNELIEAYRKISSPTVLIQKYINKKNEYCFDGFSIDKGRQVFISITSTYTYLLPDQYAKYMQMTDFNNDEVLKQITTFLSIIHYEGIFAFEYIQDQNGDLYFMENNFRNSGWSYASTCAGMPLPILWMESMIRGSINESDRKKIKEGFTFVEDVTDFDIRVRKKMISLAQWIKEYKNADCKLFLGRNDSKPLRNYVAWRITNKIRKKLGIRST